MAARSMRIVAEGTWWPGAAMVPVTAFVLPTESLLSPRMVSWTRNPAAEPAATSHVPARGPAGGLALAVDSAGGPGFGWSLMNAPTANTMRTTTPATLARIHRRH